MKAERRCIGIVVAGLLTGLLASATDGVGAQDRKRGPRGPDAPPTAEAEEPGPSAAGAAPEDGPAEAASDGSGEATGEAEPERDSQAVPPDGEVAADRAHASEQAPATPPVVDLTPLRSELAAVMDELVQARGRVSMLGKTLFKTRVRVKVQNLAGDEQRLERISLKLDGAPIFSGGAGALENDEEEQVFEGFAAPGPHTLVLEAEQRGRDDDDYRYGLRERFHFQLPPKRSTELRLILDDDSDMAEDFDEDEEGEYDIRTRLRVRAHPIGED